MTTTAAAAAATRLVELGKPPPSSALEQLDIERGVCVPFRKYSPETVRNTTRKQQDHG